MSRRYRSCQIKVRHATQELADRAANATPDKPGCRVMAYHCRFCGGWHVGNLQVGMTPAERRMLSEASRGMRKRRAGRVGCREFRKA